MAYISVNKDALMSMSERASRIRRSVNNISSEFASICRSLDSDIRNVSSVKASVSKISSSLEIQARGLSNISNFLSYACRQYSELDKQNQEKAQRINKDLSKSDVDNGSKESIWGRIKDWFIKNLVINPCKKFITAAILKFFDNGPLAIISKLTSFSGAVGLFYDITKTLFGYTKPASLKGLKYKVGKALQKNANKIKKKWPYESEFKSAKAISKRARNAFPSKTKPQWVSVFKSGLKQSFNKAVDVIKKGAKKAAIVGALVEAGTGLYHGIKNKNSASQKIKGFGFDLVKGALSGAAALAVGALASAAVTAVAPVLIPCAAVVGVVAVGASIAAGAATSSLIDYVAGSADGSGARFITNKNGEKVTLRDWVTGDNDSAVAAQQKTASQQVTVPTTTYCLAGGGVW